MEDRTLAYFVCDGCSVTGRRKIHAPHDEVTKEALGVGTDADMKKLVAKGSIYEGKMSKPAQEAADREKAAKAAEAAEKKADAPKKAAAKKPAAGATKKTDDGEGNDDSDPEVSILGGDGDQGKKPD